jgi:hypothetical protein
MNDERIEVYNRLEDSMLQVRCHIDNQFEKDKGTPNISEKEIKVILVQLYLAVTDIERAARDLARLETIELNRRPKWQFWKK